LTLTGKQLEIRKRDELFLSVARSLVLERGFQEMTIDRIAEHTGFSKGTIYLRFPCKEALLVELGIRGQDFLIAVLKRAAQYEGRPRLRMAAFGEAIDHFSREYADHARILSLINAEVVLERVSPEQQERLQAADIEFFELILGIVNEAVEIGDLVLKKGQTAESLCYALWSMVDGWASTARHTALLERFGIRHPIYEVLWNAHRLMDAYGWHPLLSEWDYKATSDHILATVIADIDRMSPKELLQG
jgi:AcrR family transcriptional regulator